VFVNQKVSLQNVPDAVEKDTQSIMYQVMIADKSVCYVMEVVS
jgi:hypothetical protein